MDVLLFARPEEELAAWERGKTSLWLQSVEYSLDRDLRESETVFDIVNDELAVVAFLASCPNWVKVRSHILWYGRDR